MEISSGFLMNRCKSLQKRSLWNKIDPGHLSHCPEPLYLSREDDEVEHRDQDRDPIQSGQRRSVASGEEPGLILLGGHDRLEPARRGRGRREVTRRESV